jgi:hypothetical protein
MYVHKALATVLLIFCSQSRVTPRYITLLTKGMPHPFSCNTLSGTLSLLEKY